MSNYDCALMFHPHNGRDGFQTSIPGKILSDFLPEIYCSLTPKILEIIQEKRQELLSNGMSDEDVYLKIKEEFDIC